MHRMPKTGCWFFCSFFFAYWHCVQALKRMPPKGRRWIMPLIALDRLHLTEKPYITLRIGIKEDAGQQGGLNLFGEQFGDYNQAIMMRLDSINESAHERSV